MNKYNVISYHIMSCHVISHIHIGMYMYIHKCTDSYRFPFSLDSGDVREFPRCLPPVEQQHEDVDGSGSIDLDEFVKVQAWRVYKPSMVAIESGKSKKPEVWDSLSFLCTRSVEI